MLVNILQSVKEWVRDWSESTFLKLSGGTLTGNLEVKSANVDITVTPESDTYNTNHFSLTDQSGAEIGKIDIGRMATGASEMRLVTYLADGAATAGNRWGLVRLGRDPANAQGYGYFFFDKTRPIIGFGTTEASVDFATTNPQLEFRNGNASQCGKLIFTDYDAVHPGATLAWVTNQTQSWFHTQHIHATGDIRANSNINILSTDVDTSSATNGLSSSLFRTYGFLDKSNRFYGYIQGIAGADGSTSIQLSSRNFGTGANVDNCITMSVANDGKRSVSVSDAAAWRNAIGVTPTQLYNNSTGTNGTVTLSDTAANYNYMRIFYTGTANWYNGTYDAVTVYAPNGKRVGLSLSAPSTTGTDTKKKIVTISANSITVYGTNYSSEWIAASSYGYSKENVIKIISVEGWN